MLEEWYLLFSPIAKYQSKPANNNILLAKPEAELLKKKPDYLKNPYLLIVNE